MQENEIIKRILNGDRRAFSELVERHQTKAMTLAMKILKNREDAEEALQDSFLRVFRALSGFEGKSNFSTWFYRIVYNVCISALEKRTGTTISTANLDDYEFEHSSPSLENAPDELLVERDDNTMIYREIERLPVEYSSVLTLFFVQQLRYDEITEVTGMPLGTVKTRLFRGRMMLREAISRHRMERVNF